MDVPYLVEQHADAHAAVRLGQQDRESLRRTCSYPNFTNINRTNDVSISVTKVKSSHTMKGGLFL